MPVSSYRVLYTDLIQRQHFLLQDQQLEDLLTNIKISNEQRLTLDHMKEQQGIILTFHTGAYRVLPRLLCELGFNIALLASSKVREEQMELLEGQHADLCLSDSNTGDFIILDAEKGNSLLQVRKALRDGYHILVYADGNTGSQQNQKDNSHSVDVPFLKQSIRQRAAMAMLSYRWQIPIHSILSIKKDEQISFCLGVPVLLGDHKDADTYSKHVYTRLYADLERLIVDDPMTWEGWRYVLTRVGSHTGLWAKLWDSMTGRRFWPLCMDGKHYALNSRCLSSQLISFNTYERLFRIKLKSLLR